MMVMNVAILTTLHSSTPERRRLTELFLRYYSPLDYRLLIAAASTKEDTDRAVKNEWMVCITSNEHLTNKWAAGMSILSHHAAVDAVVIAGSDDFIHPNWVKRATDEIQKGADFVVPRSCYLYDAPTGRACYMTRLSACGAGRVFSRRLLEMVGWNPWAMSSDVAWMPATAQERRLKGLDFRRVVIDPHDEGLPIIDVKVGDNLNSYDDLLRKTQTMDIDPFWLWSQFPTVKGAMFNWNKVAV